MADTRKDVRLEEFSPEAQDVVASKKVSGRRRLKEWQALIAELAELDAASDRLEARAKKLMIVGIVLAVIGLILSITIFGLIVGVPLLIVGGILAIYHGKRWRRFKAMDLANDFRLCLPPLIDALAEDVVEKAKVRMDLDLAGPTQDKRVKHGNIPPGRFRKVIESVYLNPWCHLVAPLVDGSQLVLDIENELTSHQRHWTTRSVSGKTKFKKKTKWKKLVVVTAAVVPNAENLQWDAGEVSARATQEKLKLAEKKGAQVCRLVRKFKFSAVNARPDGVAQPRDIMGMFMELFNMLQPAEARS